MDKSIIYFIYLVSMPKHCIWQLKLNHSHTQGLQSYLSFTSCPFPLPSSELVLHIHIQFVTSHILFFSHITLQMWLTAGVQFSNLVVTLYFLKRAWEGQGLNSRAGILWWWRIFQYIWVQSVMLQIICNSHCPLCEPVFPHSSTHSDHISLLQ